MRTEYSPRAPWPFDEKKMSQVSGPLPARHVQGVDPRERRERLRGRSGWQFRLNQPPELRGLDADELIAGDLV